MKVEIWSDIVCPWCYIGKRRFEKALDLFGQTNPAVQVDVSYRAFQLDPTAPPEVDELVLVAYERKFGRPQAARRIIDRVTSEAAAEGIAFDLTKAKRSNTLLAHRLLVMAEREGRQEAMAERLMSAYFCEGRSVGSVKTLAVLAQEAGLVAAEAEQWLNGDSGKVVVAQQLGFAAEEGITSVPTFVFGRGEISASGAILPGAQPPETLARVLTKLSA